MANRKVPTSTFNPERFPGLKGLLTASEASRLEDLIKSALDDLAKQIFINFTRIAPGLPPGTVSPSSLARYWLSIADASIPNGVNMGALGPGILQQTVTGLIAIPTAFLPTDGSVLFAGAAGTLAQDNANFFFDRSGIRWGFGTNTPDAAAQITGRKNFNGHHRWFLTNSDPGAAVGTQLLLQSSVSDTAGLPPYVALTQLGRNFASIAPFLEPFYLPANGVLQCYGDGNLIIQGARAAAAGGDVVIITSQTGVPQQEAIRVDNLTSGVKVRTLSAGGMVYADTPAGLLKLVTIGSGLTFSGGTLSAINTGSPGMVPTDGEDGAMGPPGPAGAAGVAGATGSPGPMGPPGVAGADGDDGLPGPPGRDGAAGRDGAPGVPGMDGDDAMPMMFPPGQPQFDAVSFHFYIDHTTPPGGPVGELAPSSQTPISAYGNVISYVPGSKVYRRGELKLRIINNNIAGVATYSLQVLVNGGATSTSSTITMTVGLTGTLSIEFLTGSVSVGDTYDVLVSGNAGSTIMTYTTVLRLYER